MFKIVFVFCCNLFFSPFAFPPVNSSVQWRGEFTLTGLQCSDKCPRKYGIAMVQNPPQK